MNKQSLNIAGMPWYAFFSCGLIILIAMYTSNVKDTMIFGFAICLFLGLFLTWLGNLNKYVRMIGGSALLCLFVPAMLNLFGLIPEKSLSVITNFYNGYNFLDVCLAAWTGGCILGMDRNLLIKASVRYLLPMLGALLFCALLGGLVGALTGYGFKEAILTISMPIAGAGVGSGAVPMAQIYENATGLPSDAYLSTIVPAVIVGNLVAILSASVLNVLGRKKKQPFVGFSGNGELMRTGKIEADEIKKTESTTYERLAIGFLACNSLYVLGNLIAKLVPSIHLLAWVFLAAFLLKLLNLCPKAVEAGANEWYEFLSYVGVPIILVCISFTLIDMEKILWAISNPAYLLITIVSVVFAGIGAGVIGYFVNMNFVESAMTAGLCLANSGGAGDVAVLGAGDRMNLMPFAQMSSRIGGSLVLVVMSVLINFLV